MEQIAISTRKLEFHNMVKGFLIGIIFMSVEGITVLKHYIMLFSN